VILVSVVYLLAGEQETTAMIIMMNSIGMIIDFINTSLIPYSW